MWVLHTGAYARDTRIPCVCIFFCCKYACVRVCVSVANCAGHCMEYTIDNKL